MQVVALGVEERESFPLLFPREADRIPARSASELEEVLGVPVADLLARSLVESVRRVFADRLEEAVAGPTLSIFGHDERKLDEAADLLHRTDVVSPDARRPRPLPT